MAIKFKGTVMTVGNSTVLILPKPLCENFGIKKDSKGEFPTLQILATESGLYIPLKQTEELREEIEGWVKKNKK